MAEAQNGSDGGSGVKGAGKGKVRKGRKKLKHAAQGRQHDTRVNIGPAFESWRVLKRANGLKTDAAVALCLLDEMKSGSFDSDSSEPSNKKMRISKSEVQTLIEQEVHSAMRRKENKLDCLIEKLQQELNYESAIDKLEAHINRVKRKGDAALSYIKKLNLQSPAPSLLPLALDTSRLDSKDKVKKEIMSNDKNGTNTSDGFLQTIEDTKKALKKMQEDSEAPNVQTLFKGVKNESPDHHEGSSEAEKAKRMDGRVKVECLSPRKGSNNEDPEQEEELSYPPLPSTSFPATLDMEAASYNIPQRLRIQLALIRNPPGLSVLWDVEQDDPMPPPMDSYSLYMTVEKVKGSGVFSEWKSLGEVKAIPLPMCVMISKYKPGHKLCFTVVGKDKFGRYGPYSKVVPATVPN